MRYSLEKPKPIHLLNGEPTHCHWCAGLLKRLGNIYKGQKLRAVLLLAAMSQGRRRASGAVRHRWLSLPFTLVCGSRWNARCPLDRLFINPESEGAQDQAEHDQAEHHHPFHKDFYSKWKEPGKPERILLQCSHRAGRQGKRAIANPRKPKSATAAGTFGLGR